MIHNMLQQPRQVGMPFFFSDGGRREEIILLLAAPTDNPKGEVLPCCENEIQEDGSVFT